jgi:hypothetical protein
MDKFIEQHADRISGILACFDRVLFRGYLPIMSGAAMAALLKSRDVARETLKAFLLGQAERLKRHAQNLCTQTGRPYEYLSHAARKEDLARKIAERDEITEGLVCVLSVLEPCRTFSLVWNGRSPYVQSARRKCLHFYYYFLDRDLGLIHVKLQSWFPFQIQLYVNGHEWLARQLDRHDIKYTKLDNAFVRLSDVERSQELADSFERVDWIHVLGRHALRVNPLLRQGDVLHPMQYYWVTAQSEYSTDILFRKRADLEELMPRLCQYSALYFGASDVMSFLGRKLTGRFQGEVVTDQREVELRGTRVPGRRVKHRMKFNWIKMYDKGTVLRVETVINNPEEFRVRRRVRRQGQNVMAWVPLRKSVTLLFRYREISAQSNVRYLDALSQVQDPTPAVQDLDALTTNASAKDGRTVRAFNPLSRNERMLFEVLLAGEHALHGFTNRDVRQKLGRTSYPLAPNEDKQPSQVTRLFRRLHAHGLIAKIPRSRRWRVSVAGRRTMSTAIKLREVAYPALFAAAA